MTQNFTDRMKEMLSGFKKGKNVEEDIVKLVKTSEFEDMGFAKIDRKRSIFKNFPEVIFGVGKTDDQIFSIFSRMVDHGGNVIATRVSEKVFLRLKKRFIGAKYNADASIAYYEQGFQPAPQGKVVVMTAGTADIRVAEEAALTAELSGSKVERIYDVGVAGIKRLFANISHVFDARVIIVAAGMEGALASVVSGLAPVPVIAVPTSVGYGASFKGLAALLAMLNCCSPGVSVVNIDNGFGAGYLASQINLQARPAQAAPDAKGKINGIAAAEKPAIEDKGKKRRGRPPGSGAKKAKPAGKKSGRKPGRPPKSDKLKKIALLPGVTAEKKRRGRPPGSGVKKVKPAGKKSGRKPGRPPKSDKLKKTALLPGVTAEKKRRGRPPGIEALRKGKPGRKPGKKSVKKSGRKPGRPSGMEALRKGKPGRPPKSDKLKKAALLSGATVEKKRRGRPSGMDALRKGKPGRKPGQKSAKKTDKPFQVKKDDAAKKSPETVKALNAAKKEKAPKTNTTAAAKHEVKPLTEIKAPGENKLHEAKKNHEEKPAVEEKKAHDEKINHEEKKTNHEEIKTNHVEPAVKEAEEPKSNSGDLVKEPVE